jgi:pimeloyl-ACP methyl ester carboxylesterase
VISRELRIVTPDRIALAASAAGDPSHPPVLMLHGAGQTRYSWKNGQAALAGAGYYVISYDARGHGQSDWDETGDYGPDALVCDLHAVAAQLDRHPVIVGASLGGLTALLAAGETESTLARALVIVDVAPMLNSKGAHRVREFMTGNPRGFESLEEAAQAIQRYNPKRPQSSSLNGLRRNLREVNGRLYWHWDPRILPPPGEPKFAAARLEAAARNIRVPTLLLRGGDSDLVGAAEIAAFSTLIPNLEVSEIRDAGHMIAGDRNDAFNAEILGFLGRLEAPAANSGATI